MVRTKYRDSPTIGVNVSQYMIYVTKYTQKFFFWPSSTSFVFKNVTEHDGSGNITITRVDVTIISGKMDRARRHFNSGGRPARRDRCGSGGGVANNFFRHVVRLWARAALVIRYKVGCTLVPRYMMGRRPPALTARAGPVGSRSRESERATSLE